MSAKNQRCAAGARDKDPLEEEDKHTHAREKTDFSFLFFPFIVPATVRRMDRGGGEERRKSCVSKVSLVGPPDWKRRRDGEEGRKRRRRSL